MKDRTQEYHDLLDEIRLKGIQSNGEFAYWSRVHQWYDHRPWRWIAYPLIRIRNWWVTR